MSSLAINIDGLDKFAGDLRSIDVDRALKAAHLDAAREIASDARAGAKRYGSSAAKGSASIKARARGKGAVIDLGSARHPWMLGSEFGSKQYAQFPKWRGNQFQPDTSNVGYFLHPAIRAGREDFEEIYLDAMDREAAKAAFPD